MSRPQQPAGSATHQSLSLHVATVAGIPIRIHFTFFLFLAWIGFSGGTNGGVSWSLFLVAVFFCVVLHELGHALVAKRLGVTTRDITLYPIGGVAMLEGRPKPKQELWISLAGPAVNLVLAVLIALVIVLVEGSFPRLDLGMQHSSFLTQLWIANVMLAVFNMIPAFPMDGGRVLRAWLGLRMAEARSTQIAGGIGQGLAIILAVTGLRTQSFVLVLIAIFVFVGAAQEISGTVTRSFLEGHILADVMLTRFRSLTSGESLDTAANLMIHNAQHAFPIMNGDEVIGLLTRSQLAQGLTEDGPTGYVARWMLRDFKVAGPNDPLEQAVDRFSQADPSPILVMEEDQLLGILAMENLSEFIMLENAKARRVQPTQRRI